MKEKKLSLPECKCEEHEKPNTIKHVNKVFPMQGSGGLTSISLCYPDLYGSSF